MGIRALPRHRVLVVDDSAFARKVLREVLAQDERIEVVGFARDGLDALEKIDELKPDVVTLDLVMPELDGVGVLQALAQRSDPPRIVIVTMTDANSAMGVAALAAGAFDVVQKPTALATDRLYELEKELVQAVVVAATSKRRASSSSSSPTEMEAKSVSSALPRSPTAASRSRRHTRLVVIGASTGGPRALAEILSTLPADFPVPIAAVVHMPVGYTHAFAERLDVSCALSVREATDGLVLAKGMVVIGRAGDHFRVGVAPNTPLPIGAHRVSSAIEGPIVVALEDDPLTREDRPSHHTPSVDVLFDSAAKAMGASVLAVVLTGMGNDGLVGARAIHKAGGRIITEAESSCVVYGMPRAVAEANLGAESAPLERIVATILDHL